MTENDQWTYDVFGFGMQFTAYMRDTPCSRQEGYPDRMMRTLKEVAEGDTVFTQSDADLRIALERTELPAETQRALIELQPATRARNRVIAAKLVEMMGGQGV